MAAYLKLRLSWLGLIALTLLSYAAAESLIDRRVALIGIFAIAACKGLVVASQFMEIGHALPHWRVLYRGWLIAVAIMLAAGHIF